VPLFESRAIGIDDSPFQTAIVVHPLKVYRKQFLIVASGTIAAAEDGTTLFTPRLHGDHFICTAINLSKKALGINISILDDTGQVVRSSSGDATTGKVSIPPGAEAELNFSFDAVGDPYCEVEVSGTGNRSDLRVEMDVHWTRSISLDGITIPHLQDLAVQGY
jgi:hypothetical protein